MFNFIHELYKHINPRTQILLLDRKIQNLLFTSFLFSGNALTNLRGKSMKIQVENVTQKQQQK
jgi:hypothetical protein